MKAATRPTGYLPDGSIVYDSSGFGEKCPLCGNQLNPGEMRRVVPGVWIPEHYDGCPTPKSPAPQECSICGEADHPDGTCLL